MVGRLPMEMAKTVVEVAEVALTAVECCHKYYDHHDDQSPLIETKTTSFDELEALRSENRRIRELLSDNLKLLENLADSPALLPDCPPDLRARLMALVESGNFLNQLESLQQKSVDGDGFQFPFKEASGTDHQTAEILVNMSLEEPSWWVWVSDDMIPSNVEERSRIDNENYVVVSEESVVDAIANFMAKCVLSNPNAQKLTPEELQKTLTKALSGMSKFDQMLDIWHAGAMFYTLATWGFALVGLYNARAVVRVAAMGVHHSSKLILKAI